MSHKRELLRRLWVVMISPAKSVLNLNIYLYTRMSYIGHSLPILGYDTTHTHTHPPT